MRILHLLLAISMGLALAAMTAPANAAVIDWKIAVEVNTVAQGSVSGDAILDVSVSAGDTVRFIVGIAAPAASNIASYATFLAIDPSELLYTAGSGATILPIPFAAGGDPDSVFGSDSFGLISSMTGSAAGVDFYAFSAVVRPFINSDILPDLSLGGPGTNLTTVGGTDTAAGFPSVRLNVAAVVPEPASMLLLGGGLAGLAGFARRGKSTRNG